MEKSTNILKKEHQNILAFINLMKSETNNLMEGKEINKVFWQAARDFISNYADKFHHAKEEDLLFKEMCRESVSLHCNPIEMMLYEHNLGRDYVKAIIEGIENNDKQLIINNANNYCSLLTEHIYKEDNILYPMADEALDQQTKDTLTEKFGEIEKKFTKEGLDKYLILLKDKDE